MKPKLFFYVLLPCLLFQLSTKALFAEEKANDGIGSRLYVGAGVGLTLFSPDISGAKVKDDTGNGHNFLLGYDINERISVELDLARMSGLTLKSKSTGLDMGELKYSHYGISGLAYLFNSQGFNSNYFGHYHALHKGVSLYGRLGISVMDTTSSSKTLDIDGGTSTTLFGGGGFEYGWNNGFSARAELTSYSTDIQMLSLGVTKHFGTPKANNRRGHASSEKMIAKAETGKQHDKDNDGVHDDIDRCPSTPVKSAFVNRFGCHLDLDKLNKSKTVTFLSGSTKLKKSSKVFLAWLSRRFKEFPNVGIEIHAHTDNVGSAASNQRLSKKRADAVLEVLVENGVDRDRLVPIGFGEARPIADNSQSSGRLRNRRVEFKFVK